MSHVKYNWYKQLQFFSEFNQIIFSRLIANHQNPFDTQRTGLFANLETMAFIEKESCSYSIEPQMKSINKIIGRTVVIPQFISQTSRTSSACVLRHALLLGVKLLTLI